MIAIFFALANLLCLGLGTELQQDKPSKDTTVRAVLDEIGPKIGMKFVYSKGLKLDKKDVVIPRITQEMKREELTRILERAVRAGGYALVLGDEKAVPVLVIFAHMAPKHPVTLLDAKTAIPSGDGMYTKVFKLERTTPRDVHATLINMVTFPQGIVVHQGSGLLLITDYGSNLRRFVKVIAKMDGQDP